MSQNLQFFRLPKHSSAIHIQSNRNASAKNPTAVNPVIRKLVSIMLRPWVLVLLFVMLVFMSQFEWKQQFGNETEPKLSSSSKEDVGLREEVVKEKIILSRERNIQKLQELVMNLHQQLRNCRGDNFTGTSMPFD